MIRGMTFAAGALAGSIALAQSAEVAISVDNMNPAPGDTVNVTVSAVFDTAGAGAGVFGNAGLYGFGGDVDGTGTAAATSAGNTINALLTSGATTGTNSGASAERVGAGRGLSGGLAGTMGMEDLFTYAITVDAGAADGETIDLAFDGAVVLVLDDALTTFSTNPGVNQQTLTTTGTTITVAAAGPCSIADLDGNNLIDVFDLITFLQNFEPAAACPGDMQCAIADLDGNDAIDVFDLIAFLQAFDPNDPNCTG